MTIHTRGHEHHTKAPHKQPKR
ncbi:hypothetical protein D047_2409A, partial [Vibrio parahaemolyticus VPTS-2010_2]